MYLCSIVCILSSIVFILFTFTKRRLGCCNNIFFFPLGGARFGKIVLWNSKVFEGFRRFSKQSRGEITTCNHFWKSKRFYDDCASARHARVARGAQGQADRLERGSGAGSVLMDEP